MLTHVGYRSGTDSVGARNQSLPTTPSPPGTSGPTLGAGEPEVFAPQVQLGTRINNVLRDWLHEQIQASAADVGRSWTRADSVDMWRQR